MRIIFAAGGTAGHINPAIATATAIKKRNPDAEILFIGTKNRMEHDLVPKAGFAFETISVEGFVRKKSIKAILKNIIVLFKAFFGMCKTWSIISKFKPDVVVGFGGYVSGPVVRTACKRHIPTCIHEQNAAVGVTNMLLAKKVDRVMLTDKRALDNKRFVCKNEPVITGLPVRDAICNESRQAAREEISPDDKVVVLSFGGSLGAEKINKSMVDVISTLNDKNECRFVHAYGRYGKWVPEKLKENGVETENNENVIVKEYIYDMEKYLAASDIVVSRSGASTLSEIEMIGVSSVLIPSPNVAENHQYYNARTLADVNAAVVIEEKDLTSDLLAKTVEELINNREKREEMGENAKKLSIADAQDRICEIIEGLADKNEK